MNVAEAVDLFYFDKTRGSNYAAPGTEVEEKKISMFVIMYTWLEIISPYSFVF